VDTFDVFGGRLGHFL